MNDAILVSVYESPQYGPSATAEVRLCGYSLIVAETSPFSESSLQPAVLAKSPGALKI